MLRFAERIVRSKFVTSCRLASSPTKTCPLFAKVTTEGVDGHPYSFGIMMGRPSSRAAITDFELPRSIPSVTGIRRASYPYVGASADGDVPVGSQPFPNHLHLTLSPIPSPNTY